MTEVLQFLFRGIKTIYDFGSKFSFDLFGQRVNIFSIIIGFAILGMIVKFLTLFVPSQTPGLSRIGMGKNENRKDRIQQQRELRTIREGARHVKYSGPRHSKEYFDALRKE